MSWTKLKTDEQGQHDIGDVAASRWQPVFSGEYTKQAPGTKTRTGRGRSEGGIDLGHHLRGKPHASRLDGRRVPIQRSDISRSLGPSVRCTSSRPHPHAQRPPPSLNAKAGGHVYAGHARLHVAAVLAPPHSTLGVSDNRAAASVEAARDASSPAQPLRPTAETFSLRSRRPQVRILSGAPTSQALFP